MLSMVHTTVRADGMANQELPCVQGLQLPAAQNQLAVTQCPLVHLMRWLGESHNWQAEAVLQTPSSLT